MAACFNLTKKGESEPTLLQTVDEELCRYFGVEPHATAWFRNWYNQVGFMLALGYSFDDVIAHYAEYECTDLEDITEWLKKHYIVAAWCER